MGGGRPHRPRPRSHVRRGRDGRQRPAVHAAGHRGGPRRRSGPARGAGRRAHRRVQPRPRLHDRSTTTPTRRPPASRSPSASPPGTARRGPQAATTPCPCTGASELDYSRPVVWPEGTHRPRLVALVRRVRRRRRDTRTTTPRTCSTSSVPASCMASRSAPVLRAVEEDLEHGEVGTAEERQLCTHERLPADTLGHCLVERGGVEEQVDRVVVPEQAHLTVTIDGGAIVVGHDDRLGHRREHRIPIVRRHEQVDVDVDRAACLLGAPRQRQRAAECVVDLRTGPAPRAARPSSRGRSRPPHREASEHGRWKVRAPPPDRERRRELEHLQQLASLGLTSRRGRVRTWPKLDVGRVARRLGGCGQGCRPAAPWRRSRTPPAWDGRCAARAASARWVRPARCRALRISSLLFMPPCYPIR